MPVCQNCQQEFKIAEEDKKFYKKVGVPAPTFCPTCRVQRRLSFQVGRVLYKRKVEGIKKKVFSSIKPDSPFRVYKAEGWGSSEIDAMKYGKDYDFKKPFFKQFEELMHEVGLGHIAVLNAVNSPYSNNASYIKNCYLTFNTGFSEDCAYGLDVNKCRDSFDLVTVNDSELCYDLISCGECYQVFFSSECRECSNVWFSKNLVNCQNCLVCVNLRHKKYHIFNKPYTKQEYEKKLKEFNLGSYQNIVALRKKSSEFYLKFPNKCIHGSKNVNVSGDYLRNCKNVKDCFICRDLEDSSYCQKILFFPSKECYDITVAGGELSYEIEESGGYKSNFCWFNSPKGLKNLDIGLYEIEYSVASFNSHNLFGCVNLRNKHHCILNKQYTKSSFDKLRTRIIEHMNTMPYIDKKGRIYKYGEFFPVELSPFAYNETIANEYFPLTKEQAIEQGYSWYDKPKPEYQPTIKAADLPDNIKDTDKSILKEVIECGNLETKFPKETRFPSSCAGSGVFRIIPQEYEFYKKMNLPLPGLCPDCRHRERIKQRNPMKLYLRECMNKNCTNTFQTTYAPDRPEIVYCEKCYNEAVG